MGWRLAVHGPDARRQRPEITAAANRMAEQGFRHGTAANMTSAKKKDGLHQQARREKVVGRTLLVNPKSTARRLQNRQRL
jgi:hypothetical protein